MTDPNWQKRFAKPDTADDGVQTIILVRGEDMQGKPQWAYALIPADNYLPFKQAEAKGNYRLADYGEVLRYGAGENPPAEIITEMAEAYGASAQFEEELREAMEAAAEEVATMKPLFE